MPFDPAPAAAPRARLAARRITFLLLAAAAFLGVAYAAFLPPFEGFDETAHWSYVQQLADTGRAPRQDVDLMSADVAAYPGPLPYGQAPNEASRRYPTYAAYRAAGAPALAGGPTRYAPGSGFNWQAQHPPLYYALLAPVDVLTRGIGWTDNLLALRLASFAMAFAGLALGALGTARLLPGAPWTGPILAAWPFLFPQALPEFVRVGNDSLCLLLASAAWLLLLRLLIRRGGAASSLGLGVVLGLGLLTKAFFAPVGLGVMAVLAVDWLRAGRPRAGLVRLALAGGVAAAIGGWWHVSHALHPAASEELVRFGRAGGLAAVARLASPADILRSLAVIPATFVWGGGWSLVHVPAVLLAPPLILVAVCLFDYARRLRGAGLYALAPVALALPLLAGLGWHALASAAGFAAQTPGWYLHLLAAPLGLILALGWRRPILLGVLVAYGAVLAAGLWLAELALFSGCAVKTPDKGYAFPGACLVDLHALSGLGHPALGLACLAAGAALALAAAALALRAWRAGRLESCATNDDIRSVASGPA